MRLEGVTVSAGYSDFLTHSIVSAKSQMDRLVVVTSPTDLATQKVCEFHHVECLVTNVMYEGGAPFNKGRAINAGMDALGFNDWLCHFDADIVFPPRFREMFEQARPDENFLYGVDRLMVPSYEAWTEFQLDPEPQHAKWQTIPGRKFDLGYRLNFPGDWGGWLPLGFTQLANRHAPAFDQKPWYPDDQPTAAKSDLLFAAKWPRNRRALLPESFVYHLDSGGGAAPGANWEGRTTPLFAPRSA